MSKQSIPQASPVATPAAATRSAKSVVMGQGVITPAVREHLGKATRLGAAAAKPQSVVMGQGVITPAVREHLRKAEQLRKTQR
jgi:uncharacterized protein (DUF1786 family)